MLRYVLALVGLVGVSFAVALAPTAAMASSTCVAAPGTSAVDEYCESIPGVTGGTPSQPPANNDGSAGIRSSLPPAVRAQLRTSTPADAGILALSATSDRSTPQHAPRQANVSSSALGDAAPSNSPVHAVVSAATGTTTVGAGLPFAMLGLAVAAAGIVWIRARRG